MTPVEFGETVEQSEPLEIKLADHALMGLARMPTGGWSPAPRGPDGAS